MRGVTPPHIYANISAQFQLTRLMRGVTFDPLRNFDKTEISTHTPHARRDGLWFVFSSENHVISTHTPHARRDTQNS